MACETELTAADRELLERVASRVVEHRMEVPAILTLESARPLSLIAGQAMIFFEPLVAAFLRLPDYRRFAQLVERRETLDVLVRLIEERADAAQDTRRAARDAARRKPDPVTGPTPGDASPRKAAQSPRR
jgi:hypothetical protein